MVGDILVIDVGRMRHRQPVRPSPGKIDAVIAGGKAGDQPQSRCSVEQRFVERKFARHHHDASLVEPLGRGIAP